MSHFTQIDIYNIFIYLFKFQHFTDWKCVNQLFSLCIFFISFFSFLVHLLNTDIHTNIYIFLFKNWFHRKFSDSNGLHLNVCVLLSYESYFVLLLLMCIMDMVYYVSNWLAWFLFHLLFYWYLNHWNDAICTWCWSVVFITSININIGVKNTMSWGIIDD